MTSKSLKEIKPSAIYSNSLLTRTIVVPMEQIGKNLQDVLAEKIKSSFENKCEIEGFLKSGSSKLISYSSGLVQRGNLVAFDVVFEAEVCFPVEGTILSCIAKNITKAGIRAESADAVPSPVVVFIAREHHNHNNSYFTSIKTEDRIYVRVIGQRFELNDKFVSVIGELVKTNNSKPKLTIES